MVKISKGNRKIGKVWNVSLTPIISCPDGVPCTKDCYAMKAYRQYPSTRKAWDHNLRAYLSDGEAYFDSISDQLERYAGEVFRWHVAGDIVDQKYLNGMVEVAYYHHDIKFLAFTKNYYLNFDDMPNNLIVIMSAWPGRVLPAKARAFPIAWLSHDERIDDVAIDPVECEEMCEACGMKCFKLDRLIDIVFTQH